MEVRQNTRKLKQLTRQPVPKKFLQSLYSLVCVTNLGGVWNACWGTVYDIRTSLLALHHCLMAAYYMINMLHKNLQHAKVLSLMISSKKDS